MDIVALDQLLTVGGFLAVLFVALFVIKTNKGKLKTKLTQDRRMAIGEVTALGPDARAMLLRIDEQEFLVVTAKRQAPVITPLASQKSGTKTGQETGHATDTPALDATPLARIAA